ADIRAELQRQMFDLCGVVRDENGLKALQAILGGLKERYQLVGVEDRGKLFNTELMEAVELGFLIDLSETMAAAALPRDEGRGVQGGSARERSERAVRTPWLVEHPPEAEGRGGDRRGVQ